jgi:ABC-2 type transport system ATP-binding protein
MIKANNLTKYFGNFCAIDNVSFEINKGEIVGFLGRNGAGKTTLMRIITSYLPATEGKLIINGFNIDTHSLAIRRKIGYLPETPPLYMNMLVKDYLKFAAQLKDIPGNKEKYQVEKVIDECDLKDAQNKVIGTLSKGYKQRVGIAQAIINEPEILILDEPTSGLDPIQILQVRKLIKNLQYSRTVIISTHILSEIEQIAQRVLIIKSGKIIADSALESLLNKGQKSLEEVFISLDNNNE